MNGSTMYFKNPGSTGGSVSGPTYDVLPMGQFYGVKPGV